MFDSRRWLPLLCLLFLAPAACSDDAAETGDDDLPTNADVDAPLEDLSTLITEDTPTNTELPAEAKADATFPTQHDLLETQSPVSDQQSRGICSVFSTVGLMEHLYIKADYDEAPNFSEQYLQWSVKEQVGAFPESSGSNANFNLQAVSDYGVVQEEIWPYEGRPWTAQDDEACGEDTPPVRCFTNGEPPEEASDAPAYRLPRGRWISTRTNDIKAHMYNQNQGVVVGGDFFYQAWNHGGSTLETDQDYWREGYVLYPNQDDLDASRENPVGHSILLVGWDDDLEVERLDGDGEVMLDDDGEPLTEQGFFIFKNSWGTGSFGVNNEYGDGYGFISYDYVEEFKSGRVAGVPEDRHIPAPTPDCEDDELLCDGQCIVIDESNCGECGSTCELGQICEEQQCIDVEGSLETFGYEGDEQTIPDNDPEGLTTEVEVSDAGLVQEANVEVYIEHSYNGDLQITLTSPEGTAVELMEADGTPGEDVIAEFDLDTVIGEDPNGTWTLEIVDDAKYDEGSLVAWYLNLVH